MSENPTDDWSFYRFGLLVTGKGEREFLPVFLRSLTNSGNCTFQVISKIPQRDPTTSARKLQMTGRGKAIPSKDATDIGLPARNFLMQHAHSFVILVDDLERARRERHRETFERYRAALDGVLRENCRQRASVHFLVNMMEAYYFAHADAVNAVLGTDLPDHQDDVENMPHPKNALNK